MGVDERVDRQPVRLDTRPRHISAAGRAACGTEHPLSIKSLKIDDGPADSAIQNRLTAAGFVLTTLFFAGTFALALNAQFEPQFRADFRAEFAYLEVTMVLGAVLAIAAIAGFITCQQFDGSRASWYNSKRCWFIVANIFLYLALSQAMSAGLTELVYNIDVGLKAKVLAKTLAGAATLLWVLLLFIAPIHVVHSWWPALRRGERVVSIFAYCCALAFVLGANATVYHLQNGSPKTIGAVIENIAWQLVQPWMWPDPWDASP